MSEKSREIGVLGASAAALMAGLLTSKPAGAQHQPAYEDIGDRAMVTCVQGTVCNAVEGSMHEVNVSGAPGSQVCVNMQGPRRQDGAQFKLYTWRGNEVTGTERCASQPADDHCDVTSTPLPATPNPARGSRAPESTQANNVCATVPGGADIPGQPERVVSLIGKRAANEDERRAPLTSDDPGQELRMNIHHGQASTGNGSSPEDPEPEANGDGSNVDFALRAGPMGHSNSVVDDAGTGSSFAGEVCLGANDGVAGCLNVTLEHNPLVEPISDAAGRPVDAPITGLFGKVMARVSHPFDSERRTAMELRLGGGVGTNLAGPGGEALFNGEASVGIMQRVSNAVRLGLELVGGLTRRNRPGPDDTITSGGVRGVVNFDL